MKQAILISFLILAGFTLGCSSSDHVESESQLISGTSNEPRGIVVLGAKTLQYASSVCVARCQNDWISCNYVRDGFDLCDKAYKDCLKTCKKYDGRKKLGYPPKKSCISEVGGHCVTYVSYSGFYQENSMNACEPGYAILGIHIDLNTLLCTKIFGEQTSELDRCKFGRCTKDNDMHSCPSGWYARGYHAGLEEILCSRTKGAEVKSRFVDDATQYNFYDSDSMHVCPLKNGNLSVVTGFHQGRNDLNCGLFK